MRPQWTDPEIRGSFRREARNFVSRSAGGFISCPPYVIASTARGRVVSGVEFELPDGYNTSTLNRICAITGYVDTDVAVSFRQAAELALIGFQLLELNAEGMVHPPLNYYEKQSVNHLLGSICELNFDGMDDPGLTEADIAFVAETQSLIARCG